jgi:hypothetical protein
MNDWAEKNTLQCEVVKIGLNQDKNGHILKVAIHPSDLPKDLILDPLGSRYMMVLARLNDQDEVIQPKEKSDGEKAIDIAGLLCRNPRFISWMFDYGHSPERTELGAIEGVKSHCGIESRKDFRTDGEARRRFFALRDLFEAAVRKGDVKK